MIEGLGRDDLFTVVFYQVMTDTAVYADLILPATTFLEVHDFARGYGPLSLQLVRPAIEPVGESRSNPEVFGELGKRLDLPGTVGDQIRANGRAAIRPPPDSVCGRDAENGRPEGRSISRRARGGGARRFV